MDKDKLEMKAQMKSAEVARYLMGLADGFKAGRIVVEQGVDSLVLLPAVLAEVEVEARVKKDKARFSLEVSWRTACEEDCEELRIGPGKSEKKEEKPVEAKKPEAKKPEEKKPEEKKAEPKKAEAKGPAAPVAKAVAKPAAPVAKAEALAKPEAAKPAAPSAPSASAAAPGQAKP